MASFCICGHQNPWVMALCARDHPPTWPPHTPSCSSVRSSLTFLGCRHKRQGLAKDLRYNLQSADSQYWEATQRIFLASFSSSGTLSSAMKSMIGFIQHGFAFDIMAISTPASLSSLFTSMLGSLISSILTSLGIFSVEDKANVANELACLF